MEITVAGLAAGWLVSASWLFVKLGRVGAELPDEWARRTAWLAYATADLSTWPAADVRRVNAFLTLSGLGATMAFGVVVFLLVFIVRAVRRQRDDKLIYGQTKWADPGEAKSSGISFTRTIR